MNADTEWIQLLEQSRKRLHEMSSAMQIELLSLKLGRKATKEERVTDWQARMQAVEDEHSATDFKPKPQIAKIRLAA